MARRRVVGGLEIGSLGPLWLVFFAPAAYRRWLEAAPAGEFLAAPH